MPIGSTVDLTAAPTTLDLAGTGSRRLVLGAGRTVDTDHHAAAGGQANRHAPG